MGGREGGREGKGGRGVGGRGSEAEGESGREGGGHDLKVILTVFDTAGAQDFKPKDFEKMLRGVLDTWEEKAAKPLRVSGVGSTKEAYEAQKRGDGGGGRGGGGGGGGSSRSLGE